MESKIVSKIKSAEDWVQEMADACPYAMTGQEEERIEKVIKEAQKQAIGAFKEVAKEKISLKQIDFLEATEEEKRKGVEVWSDNGGSIPEFLAIVDEDSITELFECEELKVL